jgi:hypothetical protein
MPDQFGRLTQKELDALKIMQADLGATPEQAAPFVPPSRLGNMSTGQERFPKVRSRMPAAAMAEPVVDEASLAREIAAAKQAERPLTEEEIRRRAIRNPGF